ncbi:hypothetical protein [Flavobacterium adhaerens]|uniref:hypothetical protein n=1 Tax=Flavobacterium adhaerens TaxID=3149043 RepID=UPI0032B3A6B1
MKKIFLICVFIFFSCRKEGNLIYKFQGKYGPDVATLNLVETDDKFYGTYEVFYGGNEKVKDSGKISGEKIGDTLKGKLTYVSYGGDEKTKPFILLKSGKNYKVGNGRISILLGIPYYLPNTIKFDNSFILKPVNNN